MSLIVAEQLVKRILTDSSFKEKIKQASASQQLELLKAEGYAQITEAEVWTVGSKMALANSRSELSDEELKHIVGGVNLNTFSSAVGIAAAISAILD